MVKTLSSDARSTASIPVQGGRIPHALGPKQNTKHRKPEEYENKFNKDFKNSPHQKKKKILARFPLDSSYCLLNSFIHLLTQ